MTAVTTATTTNDRNAQQSTTDVASADWPWTHCLARIFYSLAPSRLTSSDHREDGGGAALAV
jgi:hypothetical protein